MVSLIPSEDDDLDKNLVSIKKNYIKKEVNSKLQMRLLWSSIGEYDFTH